MTDNQAWGRRNDKLDPSQTIKKETINKVHLNDEAVYMGETLDFGIPSL